MIEPYSDRPDTSGSLLVNSSELTRVASAWATKGFQVNIHAIGDLANRYAIDAMVAALELVCPEQSLSECQAQRRFRIEHSQIIHPDDQSRMRLIGVIPSIQPTHATSDSKGPDNLLLDTLLLVFVDTDFTSGLCRKAAGKEANESGGLQDALSSRHETGVGQ